MNIPSLDYSGHSAITDSLFRYWSVVTSVCSAFKKHFSFVSFPVKKYDVLFWVVEWTDFT
jgi:hypothetical protein